LEKSTRWERGLGSSLKEGKFVKVAEPGGRNTGRGGEEPFHLNQLAEDSRGAGRIKWLDHYPSQGLGKKGGTFDYGNLAKWGKTGPVECEPRENERRPTPADTEQGEGGRGGVDNDFP